MRKRLERLRKSLLVMATLALVLGTYVTLFPVQPLTESVSLSRASPAYAFQTGPFLLPEEVTFTLPTMPNRLYLTYVFIQDCGDLGENLINLTALHCDVSGSDSVAWLVGTDIAMLNQSIEVTVRVPSQEWLVIFLQGQLAPGNETTVIGITASYPVIGVPLLFTAGAIAVILVVSPLWGWGRDGGTKRKAG